MKFIELIIIGIICLEFLNCIWLIIYCRLAEYVDRRNPGSLKNKNESIEKKVINNKAREESAYKRNKIKSCLGIIYGKLNGYMYGWMRWNIVRVGKIPSHHIRNFLYRYIYNMKITCKTVIYGGCEIRSPWNIKADNCVISTGCILDGRKGITIGQNTVFGGYVHIWTEEHDVDDPFFSVNLKNAQPVIIGDCCWICSDSTILPGVKVGNGAVIASRAVVTKNCEQYSVYAGIPAKKIRERNKDLRYVLSGKPHWHFW